MKKIGIILLIIIFLLGAGFVTYKILFESKVLFWIYNYTITQIQDEVKTQMNKNINICNLEGIEDKENYKFIGVIKDYTEDDFNNGVKVEFNDKVINDINLAKLDPKMTQKTIIPVDNVNDYYISASGTVYSKGYEYENSVYYNDKEALEITETKLIKDVYVALTVDGELLFSNKNEFNGYNVNIDYGNLLEYVVPYTPSESYTIASTLPWGKELSLIESVTFLNEISPTGAINWFSSCNNLKQINNLSNLNTNYVTDISNLFSYCKSLTEIDLSSFNTSEITNMDSLFRGCSSLTKLDLSSFNTSKVINMNSIFRGCTSLLEINLVSFDTSKVEFSEYMFTSCNADVSVSKLWSLTEQGTSYVKRFKIM